jgi:hypothetical protein
LRSSIRYCSRRCIKRSSSHRGRFQFSLDKQSSVSRPIAGRRYFGVAAARRPRRGGALRSAAGRDARRSSGAARLRDQNDRPKAREGMACSRLIFLPSMFLPSIRAALLDDERPSCQEPNQAKPAMPPIRH